MAGGYGTDMHAAAWLAVASASHALARQWRGGPWQTTSFPALWGTVRFNLWSVSQTNRPRVTTLKPHWAECRSPGPWVSFWYLPCVLHVIKTLRPREMQHESTDSGPLIGAKLGVAGQQAHTLTPVTLT
jgi:hypothetical protein